MSRSLVSLLALGVLLLGAGCESCRSKDAPKVPFKLPTSQRDAGAQPAQTPPSDATAASASYTPPVDKPQIDGVALPLVIVRATLAADLDGDGDRDALALIDDPEARLRLVVSEREAEGFGEAKTVDGFRVPNAAECEVNAARLDALSATKAFVTLSSSCGEPKTPHPPVYVLSSLEARPRVYETIELAAADADHEGLAISPESRDADGDGHDDVVLSLALVDAAGVKSEALALAWLDRPSGLVRDVREPEATLAAWATAADKLAAKSPDEAIARASLVLRMHRALCREANAPSLRVGGAKGIACGPAKSATQAAAVLTTAYAKLGNVRAAFDAYRALTTGRDKPDARITKAVDTALRAMPATRGVTLREGPAVELGTVPPAHLPRARFVDDGTLFVRRSSPIFYALATQTEIPAQAVQDDLVRDPSGTLAVTAVERSCTGYALRVERAPDPVAGYVPMPPVSQPPLLPLEPPPGCTSLSESQRRDDGGFRVLGWAPQGVLAARGAELFVVSLGLDGKSSAAPRKLEPGVPIPAPLPSGSATPDGSRHVEATPFGVLVYAADGSAELLRPEGFSSFAGRVKEAAISPNGRTVAVVAGDRVLVLVKGAPAAQ